jgi:hypothetical protein
LQVAVLLSARKVLARRPDETVCCGEHLRYEQRESVSRLNEHHHDRLPHPGRRVDLVRSDANPKQRGHAERLWTGVSFEGLEEHELGERQDEAEDGRTVEAAFHRVPAPDGKSNIRERIHAGSLLNQASSWGIVQRSLLQAQPLLAVLDPMQRAQGIAVEFVEEYTVPATGTG